MMRAYHFLSASYAIDDIQRRRLKISRFRDLNDPFELLGVELSDRVVRQAFLKTKQDIDSNRGVLCFSKNWSNPVLWSHYADKHRGICLGFDIDDTMVVDVKYDGERLAHDVKGAFSARKLDESFMIRVLSTKYKDWSHEDEVRVFAGLNDIDGETGHYFTDFGKTVTLREVIFGARLEPSPQQLETILSSIDSGVNLIQARLAFRSFKIVENKLKTKRLPNQRVKRTA